MSHEEAALFTGVGDDRDPRLGIPENLRKTSRRIYGYH